MERESRLVVVWGLGKGEEEGSGCKWVEGSFGGADNVLKLTVLIVITL